jgi:uncharacterized protein YbjT (DUF2867 family)
MTKPRLTVLVVGATGSIGRLAVAEAVKNGHAVRALARDPEKGRRLFPDVEVVAADLTRPETLTAAVDGVDAIAFTHGSDGGGKSGAEQVDYGGVRNVLVALGARSVRMDGGFITGSDFLMDGGVTAAYWYGDVAEVRAS